jgi:hypothetical protein
MEVMGVCCRDPIQIGHARDLPTVTMAPDFTLRGTAVRVAQHGATEWEFGHSELRNDVGFWEFGYAAWHDRIGRRPGVQTGMTAFDDKRETVN